MSNQGMKRPRPAGFIIVLFPFFGYYIPLSLDETSIQKVLTVGQYLHYYHIIHPTS